MFEIVGEVSGSHSGCDLDIENLEDAVVLGRLRKDENGRWRKTPGEEKAPSVWTHGEALPGPQHQM